MMKLKAYILFLSITKRLTMLTVVFTTNDRDLVDSPGDLEIVNVANGFRIGLRD